MRLNEIIRQDMPASTDKMAATLNLMMANSLTLNPQQWSVNEDGSVDVHGNLILTSHIMEHGKSIFEFNEVKGVFEARHTHLLTSLENFPKKIGENFSVDHTPNLKSLKGGPTEVGGCYDCELSGITNFEGIASYIGTRLDMGKCNITSLVGIADHIQHIGTTFYFDWDKITEGGLGLIMIGGGFKIGGPRLWERSPFDIIEKYLGKPDELFACQQELIDAGYEAYAQP